MRGWHMYNKIQELKGQGFSARKVARMIRSSRNTVSKYWDMRPEEYAAKYRTANRLTALTAYEPAIVKWLEAYPCMTAAQVTDWLYEKHSVDASERTVRRLVAALRERHGIARKSEPRREYEAVEELPKGQQAQLDFGEKTVRQADSGRYVKLYFAVFMLSYSRYKWGIFQDRPFTSSALVSAMYGFFEYIGGMPRQLVYDQDSIIVVSENGGDIIHTQAFAAFLADTRLEVRVCRKSDPESKGMIESCVKFVKGNFMANRLYMGLGIWNESFEHWLVRTGNSKRHGTTKRRPVEMFEEEKIHLLPLFGAAPVSVAEEPERTVRVDNTILYMSNRYSLPIGTYGKHKTVFIRVDDGKLEIMDRAGDTLAVHQLNMGKGRLVKLECHRRDRTARTNELLEKTIALLGEEFREYLARVCVEKPRYVREQLEIVVRACESYGRGRMLEAMEYCQNMALYSANDLSDAARSLGVPLAPEVAPRIPVEGERYHIQVQKRPLSVYTEVATGSGALQ